MTRLTENFNSDYFAARNALNPRKGQIVEIFVENEDDVPFWKDIFNRFGKPQVQTKVQPVSKNSLARGKTTVLKYADKVDQFLLLGVDSDYDYLLQFDGATAQSKQINSNSLIFQTYTYAIENYQCFADGLAQVVCEATLNDSESLDFVDFLEKYSETIYELFLYHCFDEKRARQQIGQKNLQRQLVMEEFCQLVTLQRVEAMTTELQRLTTTIDKKFNSLPKIEAAEFAHFRQQLETLGLTPKNTYLFIQGHTLYEKVVMVLLKTTCNSLSSQKFSEFNRLGKTSESSQKCKEYGEQLKQRNVATILHSQKEYYRCFLMSKIQTDVERYYHEFWSCESV